MTNIELYGLDYIPDIVTRLHGLQFEVHLTKIDSISYRIKDGVSTPFFRIISDKQEEIDEVIRALGAHCVRVEPLLRG